jgi:hypothetical protein
MLMFVFLPASTHAQGVMPGGWAPQFGYQVVAGPGAVGFGGGVSYVPGTSFGYVGPSYGGYGGYNPYGMGFGGNGFGGYPAFSGYSPTAGFTAPAAPVASGMNPLIQSIRQSTKKRRTR